MKDSTLSLTDKLSFDYFKKSIEQRDASFIGGYKEEYKH